MLRQMLIIILFLITVLSGILSLLLMIEPSGRLINWNFTAILGNRFDNFLLPGFIIFLTIVLPGLFCLVMLSGRNKRRYLFSLIYGLVQCSIGVYFLQFMNIPRWSIFLYIALSFFIFLISLE